MMDEQKPTTNIGGGVDHPDRHAIDDWVLNGPKNARIEELVRELTLEQGLRLHDVENVLVEALEARRDQQRRRDLG
ncbi:hypothetical protein L0664_17620 [Octadecabacter sp. G9-8]|uniref:Uncharacterized protein n=1 Tax=Octadecabacter dasysiphoniae TaxID=2909341 RepID=A0ABS9D1E0_9RHOB|nr:hypothetical protein [Octadecabacter dasysiphoniae]MCF2872889.1 hypothetical protein [Octadecabacter dasysiphoniae]